MLKHLLPEPREAAKSIHRPGCGISVTTPHIFDEMQTGTVLAG